MLNRICILLLLCGSTKYVISQTKISGKVDGLNKGSVGVYVYEDFISLNEKKIATDSIHQDSTFTITLPLTHTQRVFVRAGKREFNFYAEANKSYEVRVMAPDPSIAPVIGKCTPVAFEFNKKDSLNTWISRFNDKLDNFYSTNLTLFSNHDFKARVGAVSKFCKKTDSSFVSVSNEYFRTYRNYSYAALFEAAMAGRKYTLKKYFSGPILYQNEEYFTFFRSHFKEYFTMISLSTIAGDLQKEINEQHSYPALFTTCKQVDTLLTNDTLRELAIIQGLKDMYYKRGTTRKSVEMLLHHLSTQAMNKENRNIASNVLQRLKHMQVGTKAPKFVLKDIYGKEINLASFNGKYIYLDFFASWCVPCLQEMKAAQKLFEKYDKQVAFVSISVDDESDIVKPFVLKNKLGWTFAHYGGDMDLLDAYRLRAVPQYFLIDQDGDLLQVPAKKPNENIEDHFKEFMKK